MRNGLIEIYRSIAEPDCPADLAFLVGVGLANLPKGQVPPSAHLDCGGRLLIGSEQTQQYDLAGRRCLAPHWRAIPQGG